GLHRAAAGTVDAQDDAARALGAEGRAQAADDIVGAGRFLVGDHAAHLDQRRVGTTAARRDGGTALPGRKQHQRAEQVGKGEQLEENAPAPCPALLPHTGQHGLFQQFPALVLTLFLGRLPLVSHYTPSSERGRATGSSQSRSSAKSMISRRGENGRSRSSGCAPQPTATVSMPALRAICRSKVASPTISARSAATSQCARISCSMRGSGLLPDSSAQRVISK